MGDLVDVEHWRRWLLSRRGRACWRRWADAHRSLTGWSVEELAAPRSSNRTDRLQHDLVALTQQGESEAALTLLVQLRPGLARLVAHRRHRGSQGQEAAAEVRSVFYETVCRHRLDRRPDKIAANLILDTRQRLQRGETADLRFGPAADPLLGRAAGPGDPTERIEVRSIVRDVIERLPGSEGSRRLTAQAAYLTWILDRPQASVAAELGIEAPAVASRLHRLRTTVRQEWNRAA